MEPKVSIITVVFNGEKHLEQAIQSVINQTYQNIEYIIIDGASTDGSVAIIKKFGNQISKWLSEPDKGIYDAMNKGISLVSGELIGIINCDDWYEPHAVETVVNIYTKNKDIDVFHGLLKRRDKEGNLLFIIGQSANLLSQGMIEHPTCFVKKSVYDQYGLFNTSFRIAADYEFMLRIQQKGATFKLIDAVLANFRGGGVSDNYQQTKETLSLKHRYGFISGFKKRLLLLYFRLRGTSS